MKVCSVLMTALLLSASLAFAQVCPSSSTQSQCLVPSSTATTYTITSSTQPTSVYLPPSSGMSVLGTTQVYPAVGTCPPGMTLAYPTTGIATQGVAPVAATTGVGPVCSTAGFSSDTSCLLNELAALRGEVRSVRGEIRATALETQGRLLAANIDRLQSDEMLFRQNIAANRNLPNAQATAAQLTSSSIELNRQIDAFYRELSTIPPDLRPYLASRLNTFEIVYWTPALQRFSTYAAQFPQGAAMYQTAYASNPWLQNWQNNYLTSLNNISQTPQVFASARWWTNTAVLGSTEMYPSSMPVASAPMGTSTMYYNTTSSALPYGTGTSVAPMSSTAACGVSAVPSGQVVPLPSGAAIFIPANVFAAAPSAQVCPPVSMVTPQLSSACVAPAPSTLSSMTVVSPIIPYCATAGTSEMFGATSVAPVAGGMCVPSVTTITPTVVPPAAETTTVIPSQETTTTVISPPVTSTTTVPRNY